MISIDIRFKSSEMQLLQSIIGNKITSISHDRFMFVNASSQVVQINSTNGEFYLYSFCEPLEYFGTTEDVAVWSLEEKRYKVVDSKDFIDNPINEVVKNIFLIQENQRLYKNRKQIYDVWLTKGIIFDFGTYQLSFEKAIWFSEEIYIQKGYDLIEKFAPVSDFVNNDWGKDITAQCDRETVNLAVI